MYGGQTVALGVQETSSQVRGNKVYVPLTSKNRGSAKKFEVTKKRLLSLCCAEACCGAANTKSSARIDAGNSRMPI